MAIQDIQDNDFQEKVVESSVPVLVDFWAPWCGPCRMVHPILEQISEFFGDKLKVVKINIDDNQMVATQFGVRSIPTLLLFSNGQNLGVKVGVVSYNSLSEWIEKTVGF